MIVKLGLKRKERKSSFHFSLLTKTQLFYEKQMCDWLEKEMKDRIR